MTDVSVVLESSTNFAVGLSTRNVMKRIDMTYFKRANFMQRGLLLAGALNEIMDHLETHNGKNGVIFTCVSCKHATAYPGDLGKCCDKPLYEV